MEGLWSRVVTEAGLLALLLIGALVMLWRAYQKERDSHLQTLKDSIDSREKSARDYVRFQEVVCASTEAIRENTSALRELEKGVRQG